MSIYCRLFESTLRIQGKTGTVGILVGVEENVRPVIFVVTDSLVDVEGTGRGELGNILSCATVRLQLENITAHTFRQIES